MSNNLIGLINFEFRKLFNSGAFWIVLATAAVLGVLDYIGQDILRFENVFELVPSARAEAWAICSLDNNIDSFIYLWGSVLGTIAASMSYFDERNQNSTTVLVSRAKTSMYFLSKAVVVCISGFIIPMIPLLFSYALWCFTYPSKDYFTLFFSSPINEAHSVLTRPEDQSILRLVTLNNPDLSKVLHICLFGLWSMMLSLSSYVISLYIKMNKLINLFACATVNALIVVLLQRSQYMNYANTTFYVSSSAIGIASNSINREAWFYVPLAILLLLNTILIVIKIKSKKDYLQD